MPIKIHLSRLLGEKKLKMSELSRQTGISQYALHNLYHEKTTKISFTVLEKICKALKVTVGDILEYVPVEDENDTQA